MNNKKANEQAKPAGYKVPKFEIGDLAVYPAHGVGVIEAIEKKVVNGETHDFYMMKVLENNMTIMIPTWNVESVGLREVINEKEIPKIYKVMKERKDNPLDNQTWNRRYREYMDKIKTGSLYDVAEVYRDLSILKFTKDLSFGERKLFDTATVLLVKELSTAKNTDEETILLEIQSFFVPEEPEEPEDSENSEDPKNPDTSES
ncbi:MAG: CarD family transcriptional regulator [Deltaproteobacteria bacterium]|nr:CarD family transcriptional regulator [Deltaproteobacteria bacterium]